MEEIKTFGVLFSTKDPASVNVLERLKEMHETEDVGEEMFGHQVFRVKGIDNSRFYVTDERSVFMEHCDEQIKEDMVIFSSKHQSESGIRSLSAHTPGNWGKADMGGQDRKLCVAPARVLRMVYEKLTEEAKVLGVDAIQECTHHGPLIKKPTIFIEIGSTEEHWGGIPSAQAIVKTIIYLITNEIPEYKVAFGIGGLHHIPSFASLMLRSDYCFGHVCPKYNLENLNPKMVRQAIDRTHEEVDMIFLDWKGLKDQKARIKEMLDSMGVRYMKTKEIK